MRIMLCICIEISVVKSKTHKAKKCVFSVTAQSPSIPRVKSRMYEASQTIPTSEITTDSARSLLGTDGIPAAPTDVPTTVSPGDMSSQSFSPQVLSRGFLPMEMNSETLNSE